MDICQLVPEMLRDNSQLCRMTLSVGDMLCEVEVAIVATQAQGGERVLYRGLSAYRDPLATLH